LGGRQAFWGISVGSDSREILIAEIKNMIDREGHFRKIRLLLQLKGLIIKS